MPPWKKKKYDTEKLAFFPICTLYKINLSMEIWSLHLFKFIPFVNFLRVRRADIRHDINMGFAFLVCALMEHFLDGIAPLRLWHVNSEEYICICYSFSFGLMHQCLNRAIPSRKCSIRVHAK